MSRLPHNILNLLAYHVIDKSAKKLTNHQHHIATSFVKGEPVYMRTTYPQVSEFTPFMHHVLCVLEHCPDCDSHAFEWEWEWDHYTYVTRKHYQEIEMCPDSLKYWRPDWCYSLSQEDRIYMELADDRHKSLYLFELRNQIMNILIDNFMRGQHCETIRR